jgi:hypothetical protein
MHGDFLERKETRFLFRRTALPSPSAVIDSAVIDSAVIDSAVIDSAVIDSAVIDRGLSHRRRRPDRRFAAPAPAFGGIAPGL